MLRPAAAIALAAGAAVALPARAASAQRGASLAAEVTAGGGSGHGGEFYERGMGGVRLALGLRGSGTGAVAPYGEIAMEWLAISMGHDATCPVSPRGDCVPRYPELAGPAASLGMLARPHSRLELRAGVGGAAYAADGTRVGAVTGQLDAAAFPLRRLGVVAGTRLVVVPRYRGDRLWTNPWAVGIRVR